MINGTKRTQNKCMVKWLRFASNSRDAQSVKLTLNSVTFEDVPSQPQCTKKIIHLRF